MNIERSFASIEQIQNQIPAIKSNSTKKTNQEDSFGQILQDKVGQVKFSKHASKRLETRNIDVSLEQRERLEQATNQAREKGMNESLVMVDDLAFIVNIKNNTVVTAVKDTSKAIFTNIDGAIIN